MNKFNSAHNPLEMWVGEVDKVGPGGQAPLCFWQLESSLAVLAAAPGGQEAPHTLLGVPHRVLAVELAGQSWEPKSSVHQAARSFSGAGPGQCPTWRHRLPPRRQETLTRRKLRAQACLRGARI